MLDAGPPPLWDTFWDIFGVKNRAQKKVRKRRENRVPRGPQNRAKIEPRTPKEAPGGVPEASRKGGRKKSDFQTPWDSENEAPALSESSIFTFRRDPKNSDELEPK